LRQFTRVTTSPGCPFKCLPTTTTLLQSQGEIGTVCSVSLSSVSCPFFFPDTPPKTHVTVDSTDTSLRRVISAHATRRLASSWLFLAPQK